MRRIVIAAMSTISGLVLLFGYHTSTGQSTAGAAGTASSGTGGSTGTSPSTATPTPSATSSDSSTPSSGSSSASSSTSSGSSGSSSGTFTGDAVNTRWGVVQVQITVANGRITAAQAVQYPQDNPRDQEINSYALPVLAQEVVKAQSAQIDTVSGATVTSDGYLQSLQSAIDQAHL
jgi:uncharacterized protein with FMN-binding domain